MEQILYKKLVDFKALRDLVTNIHLKRILDEQHNQTCSRLKQFVEDLTIAGGTAGKNFTTVQFGQRNLLVLLQQDKEMMKYYRIPELEKRKIAKHESAKKNEKTVEDAYHEIMHQMNNGYVFTVSVYINDSTFKGDEAFSKKVMLKYKEMEDLHRGQTNYKETLLFFIRQIYERFLKYYNDQLDINWTSDAEVELFYIAMGDLMFAYKIISEEESTQRIQDVPECLIKLDKIMKDSIRILMDVRQNLAAITN
jgi:hypothetical protein